jgi:hypothetical protein
MSEKLVMCEACECYYNESDITSIRCYNCNKSLCHGCIIWAPREQLSNCIDCDIVEKLQSLLEAKKKRGATYRIIQLLGTYVDDMREHIETSDSWYQEKARVSPLQKIDGA